MQIVTPNTFFGTNKSVTIKRIIEFDGIVATNITDQFNKLDIVKITIFTVITDEKLHVFITKKFNAHLYLIIEEKELNRLFVDINKTALSKLLY
jgi:hypothetical protein